MTESADSVPIPASRAVSTAKRLRWPVVVTVMAMAAVGLGFYGWRSYRVSATAVDFANRFVDNILAGRLPQAVLLAIYPELRAGVTAEEAFYKQPRAVKGVRESPLYEFAFGKLDSTQVTVVGLVSTASHMQTNPTGVRMDSVLRVIVRYRLTRGEKSVTFDLVLHGYGNAGFSDYTWHIFDVADRPLG